MASKHGDGDVVNNNDNDSFASNKNLLSKKAIPEWLKDIESPFLWNTLHKHALSNEHMIQRGLEKLNELNIDAPEFSFIRYSVLLKLVLDYSLVGDNGKAEETMQTLHKELRRECAKEYPSYEKYEFILNYLVSATEANLLALNGQEDRSKQIAESLLPIHEMTISDRAGLCGVKANFFHYSGRGYDDAENTSVKFAREALMFEPNNHEWKFLLAKTLRQQRKEGTAFSTDLPKEELILLEEAVEHNRSSGYLHYLAQVYRECAAQTHKKYRTDQSYFNSELHKIVQDMQEKSLKLYKEALDANPENASNLRRVGYGIMNLPPKLADYKLAIKCLLKSLELCYTLNTLHIIGTYYHRYEKDNKKALEYFQQTVNEGSHAGLSDMVRIKFLEDPQYDPCPDLKKGLEWDLKTKNQCFIIAQLAGYFLFIKRDLFKSIEYFNQLIVADKDRTQITVFKSLFLRMYAPIDLYYYIMNEAMLFLEENKNADEEKIYEVMALIDTIGSINPALTEIQPNPQLIPEALKLSEEIMQKENENKTRNSRQHQYNNQRDNEGRGYHNDGHVRGRGGLFRPRFKDGGDESRGQDCSNQRNETNQANDDSKQRSWKSYGYRRGRGQTFGNKREKDAEQENWRKK